MNYRNLILAAAAILAVTHVSSANARNGHGFLGDVGVATGILSPSQADTLDGIHHGIGKPLDQLMTPPPAPPTGFYPPLPPVGYPPVAMPAPPMGYPPVVVGPHMGGYPPVLPPIIVRGPYYGPMMR